MVDSLSDVPAEVQIRMLRGLGDILRFANDQPTDETIYIYQAGLSLSVSGRASLLERIRVLNGLGQAEKRRGNLVEAANAYFIAIDELESAGADRAVLLRQSEVLHNLGALYRDVDQYSDAEKVLRRAIRIDEKLFGPSAIETGTSYGTLATVYLDSQNPHAALHPAARALENHVECLGPQHPYTLQSAQSRALALIRSGREAEGRLITHLYGLDDTVRGH